MKDEWNKYREKVKVKEDYQFTEQHKVCLQELLEFLDNDLPDEIRFNVLKRIFLVAASEEITDRESLLPQQFMKIARSLNDGEIILLNAVWQITNNHVGEYKEHVSANNWIQDVTKASGMKYKELVEIHEQSLMDKRLLSQRLYSDRSGVLLGKYFRLTDLGYEFCRFINNYEE